MCAFNAIVNAVQALNVTKALNAPFSLYSNVYNANMDYMEHMMEMHAKQQ